MRSRVDKSAQQSLYRGNISIFQRRFHVYHMCRLIAAESIQLQSSPQIPVFLLLLHQLLFSLRQEHFIMDLELVGGIPSNCYSFHSSLNS